MSLTRRSGGAQPAGARGVIVRLIVDEPHGDARHGALIGNAASMSDRQPPHTDAIDDEPFDSRSRHDAIVYGNSSCVGSCAEAPARRARLADFAPRRARIIFVSPVENGGKL